MLAGTKGIEEPYPHASSTDWRAFRDAFYAVVLDARRSATSPSSAPDTAEAPEARLVRALARLSPEPDGREILDSWVFEAGAEVGRHVVAKTLVDDSRDAAARAVCVALERAGAASTRRVTSFHRSFTFTFEPAPAGARAEPGLLASYVAGLLSGALGEAFNCRVVVECVEPWTFEVRLAEGRGSSA